MSTLTEKGLSTRDRILSEARRLLVECGYEALIMRDVSHYCDMKLGNLQYYFKTREDLIYAVIEAESQSDVLAIDEVLETQKDKNQILEGVIRELLGRWRRKGGSTIYSVLTLLQLHNKVFRELYNRIYANHYAALERVIRYLVPDISTSECQMRARLLTALIDGAGYQIVPGKRSLFLDQIVAEGRAIALRR